MYWAVCMQNNLIIVMFFCRIDWKRKSLYLMHTLLLWIHICHIHSLKTKRSVLVNRENNTQFSAWFAYRKTGKIWYGFGTVPSGIINTFQPLRCSHIMLWQASTPPARLLIFTHTQYTHTHHLQTWAFILAPVHSCIFALLVNHPQLLWYDTVMYHLRKRHFVL